MRARAVEVIPGGMDLLGVDCTDEDILACFGTVTAYKEDGLTLTLTPFPTHNMYMYYCR